MIDKSKRQSLLKLSGAIATPFIPSEGLANESAISALAQPLADTSPTANQSEKKEPRVAFTLGDRAVQQFELQQQSAYPTLCSPWCRSVPSSGIT